MDARRWLILALVLLPFAGFSLWLAGQFLTARRAETENILRRGQRADAEVLAIERGPRGGKITYRFIAAGWKHPITVTSRLPAGLAPLVGERIAVRYLPGHPHITVILPPH